MPTVKLGALLVAALLLSCTHRSSSPSFPDDPGRGERIGLGLVYDDLTGRVLLFGGVNAGGRSLGDTWTWDGERWRRLATVGPSPRKWPTMVYHEGRGRVMLFGGRVGNGTSTYSATDTWEWDGARWVEVAGPAPHGRDHAGMAIRGRCAELHGFSCRRKSLRRHGRSMVPRTIHKPTKSCCSAGAMGRSCMVTPGCGTVKSGDSTPSGPVPVRAESMRSSTTDAGANSFSMVEGACRPSGGFCTMKPGFLMKDGGR
jgi:hypothetical protein